MNNQNLANKIKEVRGRRGLSQERLSEDSRLSLRTIQRIEKAESIPRGDTLLKLTQALGVTPDDVLDWEMPEDRGYLALLNLSALSVVLHPLLGIIIPLVMWILKREKLHQVDDSGKKLINFQITWTLLFYITLAIFSRGKFVPIDYNFLKSFSHLIKGFMEGGFLILFPYLYNIGLIFINMRRNQQAMESRYFPAIPFLR